MLKKFFGNKEFYKNLLKISLPIILSQLISQFVSLLDNLATVYNLNSTYYNIRDLLYQHTSYNEAITLQTIPVYYLEPNTRITVKDMESGINGDFIMGTISIPFDIGSTMSITAQKVLEKI